MLSRQRRQSCHGCAYRQRVGEHGGGRRFPVVRGTRRRSTLGQQLMGGNVGDGTGPWMQPIAEIAVAGFAPNRGDLVGLAGVGVHQMLGERESGPRQGRRVDFGDRRTSPSNAHLGVGGEWGVGRWPPPDAPAGAFAGRPGAGPRAVSVRGAGSSSDRARAALRDPEDTSPAQRRHAVARRRSQRGSWELHRQSSRSGPFGRRDVAFSNQKAPESSTAWPRFGDPAAPGEDKVPPALARPGDREHSGHVRGVGRHDHLPRRLRGWPATTAGQPPRRPPRSAPDPSGPFEHDASDIERRRRVGNACRSARSAR